MELTKELEDAIVAPGPQGFHPPSAAELGVLTPDQGKGLKFGHVVEEERAPGKNDPHHGGSHGHGAHAASL